MSQHLFKITSEFQPSGDQPKAIHQLSQGISHNKPHQILMGATGSGKTFTMANIIANLNRPTLILAHNKTLAAQLCAEFKSFFPNNAVEYFVSYYDYYQPEAYLPSRDVYIEKEADINTEIERLRHSATRALFLRRDVIIVSSVSCIYGLGLPEDYYKGIIPLEVGNCYPRNELLLSLDKIQYERNDTELTQGRYRIKGDIIDIFPSWEKSLLRLEFFGDELESLSMIHPLNHTVIKTMTTFDLFPATHYVVHNYKDQALLQIKNELIQRCKELENNNKSIESHRLKSRTNYDLDMMVEVGYCKGIENYSRHLSGRKPGEPPGVLMDFFPDDFITFIDESHVTVPQIRGMYHGDQSRKQSLVDYGFRLPSAKDNRPLTFDEFMERTGPIVYVSATPGPFELDSCHKNTPPSTKNTWDNYELAEQVIRPTGLVDPEVIIQTTTGQMDHLYNEISIRVKKNERILVTTLTKQLSEEVSDFFEQKNVKSAYLHSDIKALDRVEILHHLRTGKFDVLIGVNLLREGLDLPEVSLVAILDADKEGFLRNERSLIQTIGRAARNVNGKVILYADKITDSMQRAINETNRRRVIQTEYNQKHQITPQSIIKKIPPNHTKQDAQRAQTFTRVQQVKKTTDPSQLSQLISTLEKEMKQAAKNLEFELAAVLRDEIDQLKNTSFKK